MCTGSAPNAFAMVGSAVAMTVESRFCMNIAQATITAVRRVRRLVRIRGGRAAVAHRSGRASVQPCHRCAVGKGYRTCQSLAAARLPPFVPSQFGASSNAAAD